MTTKDRAWMWDKLKIKLDMREQVKVFPATGLCYEHDDPDLWFSSEVEDLGRRGGPTRAQLDEKFNKSLQALRICNACPIKADCLEEGMRRENLDYGIWGGTLSGERLLKAGEPIYSSERKNKVSFAKQMRERYNNDTN